MVTTTTRRDSGVVKINLFSPDGRITRSGQGMLSPVFRLSQPKLLGEYLYLYIHAIHCTWEDVGYYAQETTSICITKTMSTITSTYTTDTHGNAVLKLRSGQTFPRADVTKAVQRGEGDISSVFSSLDGQSEIHLTPEQRVAIKKRLIKNPEALKASWLRLKSVLRAEIEKIDKLGSSIIPSVDFKDLTSMAPETRKDVLKRGAIVIRNVIDRDQAREWKFDIEDYIAKNPTTKGFPDSAKVVYELYWSKAQVRARSNPRMIQTLNFMNHLWHADSKTDIVLDQNISYADRLRIRNAGDSFFSLGPHSDAGSIERWEDDEYSSCYKHIWEGNWEKYDPFDASHRVEAHSDLHSSQGNCSVFRTFQGWLAISEMAPKEGTILFAPLVKEVTAYVCMKPFFDENDNFTIDTPDFPGSVPGKAQEYSPSSHPELELSKLMVSVPKVYPGDAVFWHCDLIHAVDPVHSGDHDASVMYIPSSPLCRVNAEYAMLQRESFLRGLAGPDFPGFPKGLAETEHVGRATVEDIASVGGKAALQEFVLEKFDIKDTYSPREIKTIKQFNKSLFGEE